MNSNEARFFSTLIVWAAITVIAVVLTIFHAMVEGFMAFFLPVMLLLAGMSSMRYIWRESDQGFSLERVEKAKHRSRVDRLVATLDEHELAELRAQLMADYDGEAVPLDELLAEYEQRARK